MNIRDRTPENTHDHYLLRLRRLSAHHSGVKLSSGDLNGGLAKAFENIRQLPILIIIGRARPRNSCYPATASPAGQLEFKWMAIPPDQSAVSRKA
jgi:hypothetical protein